MNPTIVLMVITEPQPGFAPSAPLETFPDCRGWSPLFERGDQPAPKDECGVRGGGLYLGIIIWLAGAIGRE